MVFSRSSINTRVSGLRRRSSRAVARPRMPAPTTMVSQGWSCILLMDGWFGDAAGAVEEVEVAPLGRLGHVLGEQALVAACGRERSGHPRRTTRGEFFFR